MPAHAGLERRLRQEMGCREASDRRAVEACADRNETARLLRAERDGALARLATADGACCSTFGCFGRPVKCQACVTDEVTQLRSRLAAADRAVDEALAEVARLRRSPLSCPFCGAACSTEGGGGRPWFVFCDSLEACGVMGPNYPTEAAAVRGWAAIRVKKEGV